MSLFILLSSEKNEPRSAAAVIGLLGHRYGRRRGLRNSLRSDSPCPFSSVSLASSPPDKGGIGVCALARISTPSPCGHSPYIPFRNTGGEVEMYSSFAFAPILYRIPRHAAGYGRGRGGLPQSLPLPVLFNPPVTTCHLLYILLGKTPRNATGHGKGGVLRYSFIM